MDTNKQTCIECNQVKLKSFKHKTDYGKKVYIDETKRQWNGNQCPDCRYLSTKDSYERYKVKTKARPRTHRKCQKCGDAVPKNLYFHCYVCHHRLPEVYDLEFDYGYEVSI